MRNLIYTFLAGIKALRKSALLQKNDFSVSSAQMSDDLKYLQNLIDEGEHQTQDFKFEISSTRKIARTLVAFANTDGGRLLIGVKDNGKITGIRSDEEYYMIEAAASLNCKPEVKFESINRVADGKNVLEIVISPSKERPHYARDDEGKWIAYYRYLDNNFMADYVLLQVWKREKRELGTFIEYSEAEKALLKLVKEKGALEFEEIKNTLSIKKRSLQKLLINLVSLNALEMELKEHRTIYRTGITEEE